MDLMVCVGSSCHLKGAEDVIKQFKMLIAENNLNDKVVLKGSFCMGACGSKGVSVKADGRLFTVSPEDASAFFKDEIIGGGIL